MRFVVVDFETANHLSSSACSIGIIYIENNQIVDKYYSLINPMTYFNAINIDIHKITPAMVESAPTFEELWQVLQHTFKDCVFVAHAVNFDYRVLEGTLNKFNIKLKKLPKLDTVAIARHIYPDLGRHNLNICANHLGISFNHHNALDDALVAAQILLNGLAHDQQLVYSLIK